MNARPAEPGSSIPARSTLPLWIDCLTDACTSQEAGFHFKEGGCFAMAAALHEVLSTFEPEAVIATTQDLGHAVVLMGPVAVDHQGDLPFESTASYGMVIDAGDIKAKAIVAGQTEGAFDADLTWARQIIQVAMTQSMQRQELTGWPVLLPNASAIARHIEATSVVSPRGLGVDVEYIEEMFECTKAILVRIPVDQVIEDKRNAPNHASIRGRDAAYAALPAETMPPILLNDFGVIEDGHHRKRSAVKRGDVWMLAYQTMDEDIDLKMPARAGRGPAP